MLYIVCYIAMQRKYQVFLMLRNKMFCAQEFQQNCIREKRTIEISGSVRRYEQCDMQS